MLPKSHPDKYSGLKIKNYVKTLPYSSDLYIWGCRPYLQYEEVFTCASIVIIHLHGTINQELKEDQLPKTPVLACGLTKPKFC